MWEVKYNELYWSSKVVCDVALGTAVTTCKIYARH